MKNEAISNVKIKEVINRLGLYIRIYMRDSNFETKIGMVNLHPTKDTHW